MERLVHRLLGNPCRHRYWRLRGRAHDSGVDQRRRNGHLLLRRRAGDQTRAHPRRAERSAPGGAAHHRGLRRHGRPSPDLLRLELRHGGFKGLGDPYGHRHRGGHGRRVHAGHTRPVMAETIPAGTGHRRRHRCDHRHRHLLLRRSVAVVVGARHRSVGSRSAHSFPRHLSGGVHRARCDLLDRSARGSRPHHPCWGRVRPAGPGDPPP